MENLVQISPILSPYLDDETSRLAPEKVQRYRKRLEKVLSPIEAWLMTIQSLLVWEKPYKSAILLGAVNVGFWWVMHWFVVYVFSTLLTWLWMMYKQRHFIGYTHAAITITHTFIFGEQWAFQRVGVSDSEMCTHTQSQTVRKMGKLLLQTTESVLSCSWFYLPWLVVPTMM